MLNNPYQSPNEGDKKRGGDGIQPPTPKKSRGDDPPDPEPMLWGPPNMDTYAPLSVILMGEGMHERLLDFLQAILTVRNDGGQQVLVRAFAHYAARNWRHRDPLRATAAAFVRAGFHLTPTGVLTAGLPAVYETLVSLFSTGGRDGGSGQG